MNTKLRPGKNINSTTHKVVANFTNGFAQNVIELENGTVLFINYGSTEVQIVERELLGDDPIAIQNVINSTPSED